MLQKSTKHYIINKLEPSEGELLIKEDSTYLTIINDIKLIHDTLQKDNSLLNKYSKVSYEDIFENIKKEEKITNDFYIEKKKNIDSMVSNVLVKIDSFKNLVDNYPYRDLNAPAAIIDTARVMDITESFYKTILSKKFNIKFKNDVGIINENIESIYKPFIIHTYSNEYLLLIKKNNPLLFDLNDLIINFKIRSNGQNVGCFLDVQFKWTKCRLFIFS